MAIDPFADCNIAIPTYECTLETCCLAQSFFLYLPNLGANLFFLIFFGVFIIPQLGLSIWKRTWGFGVGMFMGLVLEGVGYAARVMLHYQPFNNNWFLMYLICITIAPVFITAAIYLCLTRIMVLYGEHLSPVKPRTVAVTFMTSDFCSLVLQAAGGGIAETANSHKTSRAGIDIMIAGLFLQAVSIGVFLALMTLFGYRVRRHRETVSHDAEKRARRSRSLFVIFLVSLLVATVAILVRSVFRVVELWSGFAGHLWNSETDFLVLDGAMIGLSVLLLTAFHPGMAFGSEWSTANWSFKTGRR